MAKVETMNLFFIITNLAIAALTAWAGKVYSEPFGKWWNEHKDDHAEVPTEINRLMVRAGLCWAISTVLLALAFIGLWRLS